MYFYCIAYGSCFVSFQNAMGGRMGKTYPLRIQPDVSWPFCEHHPAPFDRCERIPAVVLSWRSSTEYQRLFAHSRRGNRNTHTNKLWPQFRSRNGTSCRTGDCCTISEMYRGRPRGNTNDFLTEKNPKLDYERLRAKDRSSLPKDKWSRARNLSVQLSLRLTAHSTY